MEVVNLEPYPMLKAVVAQHQRQTKSGKVVTVRQHQTSRSSGSDKSPSYDKLSDSDKKGLWQWANDYMKMYGFGNIKGANETLTNLNKRAKALGVSSVDAERVFGLSTFREAHDKAASESDKGKEPSRTVATGKSIESITKIIGKYLFSSNINLRKRSDGDYDVYNSRGKTSSFRVQPHRGGFKFVELSDTVKKSINLEPYPMLKAVVSQHQRKTSSGKVVMVRQHQTSRSKSRGGEQVKPAREYKVSHAGGNYVTTHLDLKGRGITQKGDGSDNTRGLKTYHITEAAFKKVQQEHGEFHYKDTGASLTRGESARREATLTEKNAASQKVADIKAMREKVNKKLSPDDKHGLRMWADDYMKMYKHGNTKGADEMLSNIYKRAKKVGVSSGEIDAFLGLPEFRKAWHSSKRSSETTTKKSIAGDTMDTVSLDKYPAMQKSITDGSLSKSLDFKKSGTVIKQAIMIKIGQCQADLNQMLVDHRAGKKVVSRYDHVNDMADSVTVSAGEISDTSKEEPEPYKIKYKRREIDDLNRIYRNLDDKKTYSLSEYDLKTYGL